MKENETKLQKREFPALCCQGNPASLSGRLLPPLALAEYEIRTKM
jgi:hypothetical protein